MPAAAKFPINTLTVGELLELLEGHDENERVVVVCDYGDYHHTMQALPILAAEVLPLVKEDGYSKSGWAIFEKDEDGDEEYCEGCKERGETEEADSGVLKGMQLCAKCRGEEAAEPPRAVCLLTQWIN